jgi:cysteine-rich repeat protein
VPSYIKINTNSGAQTIVKGFGSKQIFRQKLQLTEAFLKANVLETKYLNSAGVCGNGAVEAGESCDDANASNGDGCSSTCAVELGFSCFGSPSVCNSTCGDGVVAASESCDDGNQNNGDGCSSTCGVELGYSCTGIPSTCITVCGDGQVAGPETCDDGNLNNGDGCTNSCLIEPGFVCQGNPSTCVVNGICGNGIIEGGETCDDANLTNGDGCNNICQIEVPMAIKGVAINDTGAINNPTAMLDVNSTAGGILIPRLSSSQREGIVSPAIGLLVFDSTTTSFWYFKGATFGWVELAIK